MRSSGNSARRTLRRTISWKSKATGPTPVSDACGPDAFIEGLRQLGYEAQTLPDRPDHVFFNYPVEIGSRAGQTVRLGLVVPQDFPNIPPGGPHVSPHIQ